MSVVPVIAVDAMGGDFGPSVTVPAAAIALEANKDLQIILVGDEDTLSQALLTQPAFLKERIRIHHASQQVEMDEQPAKVLKNKKDSSMRVAINLVRDDEAGACVSAGNTGALMATARFVLKMIPGIDRPAMIGILPSIKGITHVLDLGANVDCTAENLFQFAVMGYELVRAVEHIDHPTVGLMNVGSEEIKGNIQVKQASKLLADSHLNYAGYVEGDDICAGDVDIVVADGFVGNVALKASEGMAKMIRYEFKKAFSRNLLSKIAGIIVLPILKTFTHRFDPSKYNGATMLGLRGIVVKSHGSSSSVAFANAIRIAVREVEQDVPKKIGDLIENIFSERISA